ncbi:hypothetical protein [Neorhizobium sp. DAR64860/K0K1]|uniref:hypothetical protein n=1 Tax=Neorhizobium sp. DAR64860/K0K1 TaxID=3421955 RepID=UPI003D2D21E6
MSTKMSDRETGADRQYHRIAEDDFRLSRRSFLLSSAALAVSTTSSLSFPKLSLADTGASINRIRAAPPIGGGSSLTVTQSEDTVLSETSNQFVSSLGQKASGISGIDNPRIRVMRADDQLDLLFDLENLRVEYAHDGSVAQFTRIVADDAGRITVHLPGQHVFEPTFFVSASGGDPVLLPPLKVRLGDPARLVFEYRGNGPLPFSVDTLLDWQRFKPLVPTSPVPPGSFRKPTTSETAIEAPYGLYLAPHDDHSWRQAKRSVGKSGFNEAWHASLVGKPTRLLRSGFENANVVAVWSRDPDEASLGRSPIDSRTRGEIVNLTHGADGNPTPITAHTLMLTGQGAFLNLRANFPYDCTRPISLTHVSQRSAYGQDNDVVISRRGFLYPFGHEVETVWATTRESVQVVPMVGSIPVEGDYLRTRLFIQFKQQERSYLDMVGGATLPFRSIRFEDDLSPPLDEPVTASVSIAKPDGTLWADKAFWPSAGGKPFMFSAVAEDWAGKLVKLSVPVIFIEFDATSTDSTPVAETDEYLQRLRQVETVYRTSELGVTGIYDASVAVSVPGTPLDTSVELLKVQFDAAIEPRSVCPAINSLFDLTVPQIQARLPMLRATVSESENLGWFSIQDPSKNEMETFLQAAPGLKAGDEKRIRLGCSGQSEKSGGFFSLDMTVGGVSRLYGATGQQNSTAPLALAGPQTFNPLDYFGDDTVLFGGIKIKDVLQAGLSVAEAQMPKVIQRIRAYPDIPAEMRQSIDWTTEQFQSWPDPNKPIFAVQQNSPDLVVDGGSPTRFTLTAQTSVSIDTSIRPKATVSARLSNFSLQLLFGDDGVLIRFRSFAFAIDTAGTTSFKPDIVSVELKGAIMAFIQALQELLKDILGDIGISINLLPSGVEIQLPSFNFPSLSFGAFLLQNLSIASSVEISFRSQPTRYKFNFSTPENPFTVAVGIYGGAGAFSLAIDTRGIRSFSATFGFGAFARLDLGIASGSAAVLGGLSYWMETADIGGVPTTNIRYLFYVRAYGSVTALGFITVGVDFYLGLQIQTGTPSYSEGIVEVSYSVKIAFFKKSFKLTFRRKFNGSGGNASLLAASDPSGRTRRETLTKPQWTKYRRAFAGRN